MAVLVDPSQHDSAATRAAATAAPAAPAAPGLEQPRPRLAEPPIPGGKVEALMGALIKVLAHSRLARPLPAVSLSLLGLLGVAFVGLSATAPRPANATPPVLLPFTALARSAGLPPLGDDPSDVIMYGSIGLCCLGLAMMLWANSHGWSPSPRKVLWASAGVVAVLVNVSPVGSADIASYASYGRLAALGANPYLVGPAALPGGTANPYTAMVNPMWRHTPSVYGPIATWIQLLAASLGGARPWLTIWILMIITGAAFVLTGCVLARYAENPVRAVLMWAANPLLIVELVMGGHLDAFLALAAVAAIITSRRAATWRGDVLVGLLTGLAGGIKINAAYVALAIAIPLIRARQWRRLALTTAVAALTTGLLYYVSWGFGALKPLGAASKMIISPTIWRLIQVWCQQVDPSSTHGVATFIGFAWYPVMLALAWYFYNRLSPDVPTVVAATCALTFAWVLAASWSLPWYTSVAWVALALLPRNSLTRWLCLATGVLALLHFNGGWPHSVTVGPTP